MLQPLQSGMRRQDKPDLLLRVPFHDVSEAAYAPPELSAVSTVRCFSSAPIPAMTGTPPPRPIPDQVVEVLLGPVLAVHVADGVRALEVILAPPVAGDLAPK